MTMQDAIIALLLEQPFYGHIVASLPMEQGDVPTIVFCFEPNPRVCYNRTWLESQPRDKAVGSLMHQMLHMMLLHPFRRSGRDATLWSIACDMAVNEHIPDRMLPEDAVTVKAMHSEVAGLKDMCSAEEYYEILKDNPGSVSFLQADLRIEAVLANGTKLKSERMDDADESAAAVVKGLLAETLRQCSEETETPAVLLVQLGEVYRSDRLNWRSILKRFLTGRGRLSTRKTYKRASKRFDDFPGNKHVTGIDVLVAIDESGSIPLETLRAFYAEVLSIEQITGISMMVTTFDTTCSVPVKAKLFMADKARKKSGGTDFRPVFALADSMRVPLLILFTDGDGPAPNTANQKTLWVLTPGGKRPCDFGESVVCDIGEAKR